MGDGFRNTRMSLNLPPPPVSCKQTQLIYWLLGTYTVFIGKLSFLSPFSGQASQTILMLSSHVPIISPFYSASEHRGIMVIFYISLGLER